MCIIKYYGGCKRNVLSNLCVVGIVYIGRVYNFLLLNVKGVVIVVVFSVVLVFLGFLSGVVSVRV